MSDTTPHSGDEPLDLPEFDAPPAAPLPLAREWLDGARERGVSEPLSMTLATASRDGAVSARTVDVKRIDERGLVFGTSLRSPTGRQLGENPSAALQVYWRESSQQLRFEGRIETMTDAESDALFADRSPASRAATAAARQSVPFDAAVTPTTLLKEAGELLERFGDVVPRPADWVAYRLVPTAVEFWHASRDRMHRRLLFTAVGDGWRRERLQP